MTAEIESKAPQNGAYFLGAFTLYIDHQALYKDGQEVTVEPKVFDVLLYLCQNHDRYVQISELHDKVWQGRIVSDAAVRRSISKLRHLLDYDDKQYIKSIHKRGYKLDCLVQYQHDNSEPLTELKLSTEVQGEFTAAQQSKSSRLSSWTKPFLIFVLLLGSSVVSWPYLYAEFMAQDHGSEVKLLMFPGEKSHAVLNREANILAFTGKVIGNQGFQLFVSTPANGDVRQLTSNENNVIGVGISADLKSVLFIDMTLGSSSIKRLPIDGSAEIPDILLQGYYLISDMTISPNNEGFYFSGLKAKNYSSQIYYFDYVTEKVTNVTSGYRSDLHDYKVAISTDGRLLAVTSVSGGGEEHTITVYNTKNRSIVKRFFHNSPIFYLSWASNERLLALDKKHIFEISLDKGIKRNLVKNVQGKITSIAAIDENTVLILKASPSESLFMEVSIPSFDIASQKMVTKSEGLIREAFYFASDDSILFNKSHGNENIATVKHITSASEQVLLKTVASMSVIDASSNGTFVLLKLGGTLALLNKQSSEIKYLAGGSQFVSIDASFSNDSKYVFFGEKVQNGWVVKQYNVATNEVTVFLNGYQSIRQVVGGYLLIDENDKLHQYDINSSQVTALNIDITVDENTRWFVREEYLYWSRFDGKSSFFNIFNLTTKALKKIQFGASQIDTRFDINQNGTKALLRNSIPSETNILELTLP